MTLLLTALWFFPVGMAGITLLALALVALVTLMARTGISR